VGPSLTRAGLFTSHIDARELEEGSENILRLLTQTCLKFALSPGLQPATPAALIKKSFVAGGWAFRVEPALAQPAEEKNTAVQKSAEGRTADQRIPTLVAVELVILVLAHSPGNDEQSSTALEVTHNRNSDRSGQGAGAETGIRCWIGTTSFLASPPDHRVIWHAAVK
jgi:hypothetical protein